MYSNLTQILTFTTLQNREGGEHSLDSGLSVYPNPNRGTFAVKLAAPEAGTAVVELFDLSGKRVYLQNTLLVSGLNEIPVSAPADLAGVFFLKISGVGVSETAKVIIQ